MRQDQFLPMRPSRALGLALTIVLTGPGVAIAAITSPDDNKTYLRSSLAGDGTRLLSSAFNPTTKRYRLARVTRGGLEEIPGIRSRAIPFDVDLGTDARNRPAAVYSRCSSESRQREEQPGCSIRILDLATGRERRAGLRRPADASDTSPAIWHGRIAFSRVYTTTPRRGNEIRVTAGGPTSRMVYVERPLKVRQGLRLEGIDLRGNTLVWLSRQKLPSACPERASDSAGSRDLYELRRRDLRMSVTSTLSRACSQYEYTYLAAPSLDKDGHLWFLRRSAGQADGAVEVIRQSTRVEPIISLPPSTTALAPGPASEWWFGFAGPAYGTRTLDMFSPTP